MQQAEVRLLEVDEAIGEAAERELSAWIVAHGLSDDDEGELLRGLSERLDAMGFGLRRSACGTELLHPVLEARGYNWRRDRGLKQEDYARGMMDDPDDNWIRSPFYVLVGEHQRYPDKLVHEMRRRLDAGYQSGEFPMLDGFRAEGITDYVALSVRFGRNVGSHDVEGMICSWQSDRPGGFSDRQVELLRRITPLFALAYKSIASLHTSRVLVSTYLGADAGRRVLAGDIVRGRADTVRAVIWYSDLQGFTRITDTVPQDAILDLLNDYADCLVSAVQQHGGQVLKFIGDGILAMFTLDGGDDARICARALDAALAARRMTAELNDRRAANGKPVTGFYLSLHVGDVLYGNIGSRDRLDFTVVGPAVNEAARIEAMCRSLDQWVIVSAAFAEAAGDARSRLVSLGRYALRGVRRPEELFTVDPGA